MKYYQDDEIEFRRDDNDGKYPFARGLVVYSYGGTFEEIVDNARKEFNLGPEWKLVRGEMA